MLIHRLINLKPAIDAGNISLGKYICWINDEFCIKHEVQLLSVLEKELKINIPIIIFNGNIVSEEPRNITNTKKNMPVNTRGSSRDHKYPNT